MTFKNVYYTLKYHKIYLLLRKRFFFFRSFVSSCKQKKNNRILFKLYNNFSSISNNGLTSTAGARNRGSSWHLKDAFQFCIHKLIWFSFFPLKMKKKLNKKLCSKRNLKRKKTFCCEKEKSYK